MTFVAGIDGAPGGWAVVIMDAGRPIIRKVAAISEILDEVERFEIVAIDIPIGLLDAYEKGGRACDRAARKALGKPRGSSVFPAPVRSILSAVSWEDACARSRRSAPNGKAITKQTFAILPKIREVDELLRKRPELRGMIHEVHPEVCFCELVGKPMVHHKATLGGREERRSALREHFPGLAALEKSGRDLGLPTEDTVDAVAACWSALRLARGAGRSLCTDIRFDAAGLPMTIWV